MKKTLLTLIVALAFASTAFAEDGKDGKGEEKSDEMMKGARLGFHLAGVAGNDLSVGWHLGGAMDVMKFLDWGVGDGALGLQLFLQPGVTFVTRSSILDKNTYWLEVPVLASFRFTLFKNYFRYNIGPYIAAGLFGDFEGYKIPDPANPGKMKTRSSSRFDVGYATAFGHESFKWLYEEFSVAGGFLDMYDDMSGSSTFIIKFTVGVNF